MDHASRIMDHRSNLFWNSCIHYFLILLYEVYCVRDKNHCCVLCDVTRDSLGISCTSRSTTRFIHDRLREHLNSVNFSLKKHLSKCQNKVHKGIEIKTIVVENDPANLRLPKLFMYETTNPPSTPERNAANSRTFYSKDLFYFDTRSLDHTTKFYSFLYLIIYLRPLPHILSLFTRCYITPVYKPYAEYF